MPLHTVTLPILVAAWEVREQPDGWVCLVSDSPTRYEESERAVCVVTDKDIKKRLTPEEIALVDGALQLRQAYAERDDYFLERTSQKIEQSFKHVRAFVPRFKRERAAKLVKVRGNWPGVRWVYSSLMSNLLRDSRVVMWCSDKDGKFLPGVYCPNWRTAAFALMFMDGMRICPQCGIWFSPETCKQEYCKTSHGVNYRTARSRWNAKQRAKDGKRNSSAYRQNARWRTDTLR